MDIRNLAQTVVVGIATMVSSPLVAFAETNEDVVVRIEFPIDNPVSIGSGWSILDNRRTLQKCISFEEDKLDFQDRQATISVVEDHEALSDALDISVTAKYRAALSNFSASTRFVQSTKFEAKSTHVAVSAQVDEGPRFVKPTTFTGTPANPQDVAARVELLPEFVDLARNDLNEFHRQCGEGFVAVIHSGARLNAVLTFSDTTTEEHRAIDASLSGGGGGASFSASFRSTMDSFSNARRFTVSYLGLGGAADTIPLTKEGLLSAVESLPAVSRAAPRPFTMMVQRYDSLGNWPDIIIPRSLSDAEVLAQTYWRLFTLRSYAQDAAFDSGWMLNLDTRKEDVLILEQNISRDMEVVRSLLLDCVLEDECDVGDWRDWNDYGIRSRLPFRGSWSDIDYDPNGFDLEDAITELSTARMEQWIIPVWQARCSRGACLSAAEIEAHRKTMEERAAQRLED